MSQYKHKRQLREYNQLLSRQHMYEYELHKLESNQKSVYTRQFLVSKIERIHKMIHYC